MPRRSHDPRPSRSVDVSVPRRRGILARSSNLVTGTGAMLALVGASFLVASPAAAASPVMHDGSAYTYTVSGGDATITDFAGGAGVTEIEVPTTVDGYPVVAIGNDAFNHWNEPHLTSVVIPEGVTDLGTQAFASNDLASLSLPESLRTIGAYAFYRNSLTKLTLPSGITTIGESAFGRNELTSVTIPALVTSMGLEVFVSNPGLAAVYFEGKAPTQFYSPSFPLGGSILGGFDSNVSTLVLYFKQGAIGFTTPTWNGYNTLAGLWAPALTASAPSTAARIGSPYGPYTLTATGSPDPTFAVATGQLPPGVALDSVTGVLSGTPTGSGGSYPVTFTAKNSEGTSPAEGVTIQVVDAPMFTADSPTTTATVGTAYPPYEFAASGYPTAMTFAVASGALPPGLVLSPQGVLSGTPSGTGGLYSFTLSAENTTSPNAASASHAIEVSAAPVFTADNPTTSAKVGVPYSYTYTATGYPAPTFTATGLPAGLTLSSTGVLSGTPTGKGGKTVSFAVTASNTVADTVGTSHSLTITPAAVTPTPPGPTPSPDDSPTPSSDQPEGLASTGTDARALALGGAGSLALLIAGGILLYSRRARHQ